MVDLTPQPGNAVAQAPTSGVSPAQIAAPYAEFGKALDSVAGGLDEAAVRAAHEQAQSAVTRDQDGNLKIQPMPFLLGRAADEYKRVALQSYVAQLDPEVKNKVTEAATKYEGRPQEFQNWGQSYADELAANQQSPELQNAARGLAARYVGETANGLIIRQGRRDLASAQDAISTQQQTIQNDLTAMADGGMDSAAPEYQSRIADWLRLQSDRRANPAYGYSETQAAFDRDQFLSNLGAAHFLYQVKAIAGDTSVDESGNPHGGYSAALHFADNILTDPSIKLSFDQRQKYWVKAATELRALRVDQIQDRKDARADGQELIFQSNTGSTINPDDVNRAAENMRKAGDVAGAARFLATFVNKPFNDGFGTQPLPTMALQTQALKGANVASSPAEMALIQRESGGNPARVNKLGFAGLYQFGAPLLKDLGFYQPGAGENVKDRSAPGQWSGQKWSGTFNVPGFPEVKTLKDFLASPAAQKSAYDAHVASMDNQIATTGLNKYEGSTVGGVPITHDGLRAMIHLGGVQGTQSVLQRGGAINPADANGTALLDYARLGLHPTLATNPANMAWLAAHRSLELSDAAGKAWQGVMKDYTESKIFPNDATFNQIADAARISGNAGLLRQMATDRDRMAIVREGAQNPLPEQHSAVTSLEAAGTSGQLAPGQYGVLKDLQGRYTAITKGLAENPISTTVQNFPDRFNTPAPLNLQDPKQFAAGIAQRGRIAQFAKENWQSGPVAALDKADLGQIQGALDSPDPNVKAAIFQGLSVLPDDVRGATLKKLAGNDPATMTEAAAGSMMATAPDVAVSIFRGLAAMSVKEGKGSNARSVYAVQSAQDWDKELNKVSVLPPTAFSVPGRTDPSGPYAVARDMIRARYVDLSAQAGDTSGTMVTARLQKAAGDVTGGVLHLNDGSFIAPARGMPQSSFDRVLYGIKDNDMAGVTTLNGQPVTADYLRQNAQLESYKSGRYLVRLGKDQQKPIYAYIGANSEVPQKFVLDLRNRTMGDAPPAAPMDFAAQ